MVSREAQLHYGKMEAVSGGWMGMSVNGTGAVA